MKKNNVFVAVDIQNDFASEGGKFYTPKPSIGFLRQTLFPFIRKRNIKVNEIISDYRQPRPGDQGDCCHPGEWGYKSLVPDNLKKSIWVKCMNSPIWVRENIGKADTKPGLPYPDSDGFGRWLQKNMGKPEEVTPVVFGLTIDCCVLSVLQELSWRGYYPLVLRNAVDHASGKMEDRDKVLETPIPNWAKVVSWKDIQGELE